MGQILRLDHRGHGPVAKWEIGDKAEIKTAAEVFDDHRAKGFAMFDISDPLDVGKQLIAFKPEATEILALPKMAGG